MSWKSHWGFAKDPFGEHDSPYVSLPSHDEAVARLIHTIESAEPRAFLTADAGLGKSAVLRRAFAEMQSPRRRFAVVSCPRDGTLLFARLADRLAERVGREPSRLGSWRALERAIRVASIQGIQVVLGIDDCQSAGPDLRRDIHSLAGMGTGTNAMLTVIQVGQRGRASRDERADRWTLAIGLESLTRSEAEHYLATKLAGAGCNDQIFTARAITRLHSHSAGVPRALQQLATLCLMAGAVRGLEVISPEMVDGVAEEFGGPAPGSRGAA